MALVSIPEIRHTASCGVNIDRSGLIITWEPLVVDVGNPPTLPEGLGTMAETSTLVPEGPRMHFEIGLVITCNLSDPKGDSQSLSPVTNPAERHLSLLHRDLVAS